MKLPGFYFCISFESRVHAATPAYINCLKMKEMLPQGQDCNASIKSYDWSAGRPRLQCVV